MTENTVTCRSAKGTREAQSFDDFAADYDRRDEVSGGWLTDWLDGVLAGRSGESAIDLGCGTGRVAAKLAEHYTHVRAVDLSPEMVELARRKYGHPRITFEQGDLDTVSGQYDFVVSLMTLHHVPDLQSTLRRINGLVAPGGSVVLVDGAGPHPQSRWAFYFWHTAGLARDIRNAWRKFRVSNNRKWVDHLVSDRFLPVQEFTSAYGQAFPGASVRPLSGLQTVVWQRPDD
jgi:ubiquinone/menaquinone biosynthesis C-methylase UbiE